MRATARAALARIGIAIDVDTRVGALSLAERQLIEIAKALAQRPSILVLDEPTAALGNREAEHLFGILRALRAEGMSIVYVSHRFREILDLCDRATVLQNGAVVTTASLAGWTEADLAEAMVGDRTQMFERARGSDRGSADRGPRPLLSRPGQSNLLLSRSGGDCGVCIGLLAPGQNEIALLLAGDLRPDAGSIAVRGRNVVMRHPSDGNAEGICLVSDERKREGILPNLALRENVALPSLSCSPCRWAARRHHCRETGGRPRNGAIRRSRRLARDPDTTLSGGNQQKSLIARWHLAAAVVFILIEPTHGVDVAARAQIYRRLEALAAGGGALIVVSSEITEILAIADRILVIREGRIAGETTTVDTDEESLNLMI